MKTILTIILIAVISLTVSAQSYEQVEKHAGFDTTIMTIHHEVDLNVCPIARYKITVVDTTRKADIKYIFVEFNPQDVRNVLPEKEKQMADIDAEITYIQSVLPEYADYENEPIESIKAIKEQIFKEYSTKLKELNKQKEELQTDVNILNELSVDVGFMEGVNNGKNKEHLKLFRRYCE